MTFDPAALDDVLSSLSVRTGPARRSVLGAGGLHPLVPGHVTLIYVVEGEISADPRDTLACDLDVEAGTASRVDGSRTLLAGDAIVSAGHQPSVLHSESGARIVTVQMDLDWPRAALPLPSLVLVGGFAALEPAAAALAAELGTCPVDEEGVRLGDSIICRTMVTAVLLAVIRAWAHSTCAPHGWPRRAQDPFLERVAAAVIDEPGHEWTVDTLASLGAMSRSVFAERFRSEFGQSPASFVTGVRMARAKTMLGAGHSVSETSRELGYTSDEGFSRAFRRHTGTAPSQWRARHRDEVAS
ncbi:helix-turn-helix transcriptional regulator [Labedella endophytica]|uniref:AraC family transcriptional regulator n=1 Tax=Labedella endophytica TaxID=1523160 RepID=A0A3S0X7B3_9MICO|nr:AraC family transcriptional regulator [Labedella endophytica]RUR01028.1 AraC family transcriptional regulator [Labedella endophytica]